jgi:precorrin-3B methylase
VLSLSDHLKPWAIIAARLKAAAAADLIGSSQTQVAGREAGRA